MATMSDGDVSSGPSLASPLSTDGMEGAEGENVQNETLPSITIKVEHLAPSTPGDAELMEQSPGGEGDDQRPAGGGKKKGRFKDDKTCKVCGDRALGCNFDAISCESCKAFFRRNALKDKKTKCLFNGNCTIDINTRRFCPHCRLQKCFQVGMKRELILDDGERKKRMAKVKQNREKRHGKPSLSNPTSPQMPLTPQTPQTPGTDNMSVMSHSPQSLPASSTPPIDTSSSGDGEQVCIVPHMETTAVDPSQLILPPMDSFPLYPGVSSPDSDGPTTVNWSSMSNLLSMLRKIKNHALVDVPTNGIQVDPYLLRKLTSEERDMLTELQEVYNLSFTVDLEPLVHVKQLDPTINQLVNQSSITVLRFIKFAKRLEEFVHLPQECQIGILKGTWIHILLLRSVSMYDGDRDIWVTPRGDILRTEILKNATGFVNLHDDHVRYCKSINDIVKNDVTIIAILLVIVLFSPEGPHVTTRELVSNIQDKYLILLKHYLEAKYSYVKAADLYPIVMGKLKELKELAENHGKYLMEINPREIEPIMLEILDLK